MKSRMMILALIFFLFLTLLSCNDDDDDDSSDSGSDDDQEDDDAPDELPGCEENQQPQLIGVSAIVNGQQVEMPVTVKTSDTLALAMEYADGDCNLEGGRASLQPDQEEPDRIELIEAIWLQWDIAGIGCSSDKAGEPFLLSIDPTDLIIPEGLTRTLPWIFNIYDKCDSVSTPNFLTVDITVEPTDS